MRVPQVTERMKEAPAHALRAVFAGIGQVRIVELAKNQGKGAALRAPPQPSPLNQKMRPRNQPPHRRTTGPRISPPGIFVE